MSESEVEKEAENKIREWLDRPQDEIWTDVQDDADYEVSSFGRVRSKDRNVRGSHNTIQFRPGKLLKIHQFSTGYCYVVMRNKNRLVHRLVACAFIANPSAKQEVNHIDGDKTNNHVSNLSWVTSQENTAHAIATGLMSVSDRAHMITMSQCARSKVCRKVQCEETGKFMNLLARVRKLCTYV